MTILSEVKVCLAILTKNICCVILLLVNKLTILKLTIGVMQ